MKREIRDELEVPGYVGVFESISLADAKKEVNVILARYEAKGLTKLKEIPEGVDKDRLRSLFRAMGIGVGF